LLLLFSALLKPNNPMQQLDATARTSRASTTFNIIPSLSRMQ